jgi:hypothetical protein
VANQSNYEGADENIAAARPESYAFSGGSRQIWGYDNVAGKGINTIFGTNLAITAYGYNWYAPGGSSVSGQGQIFPTGVYAFQSDMKVYVTEIDFGPTPIWGQTFVITDSNVQTTNFVLPFQAGIAATGRQVDEEDMDKIALVAVVGAGFFTLYTEGIDGPLSGKYKIGYQIGVL